MHSMLPLSKNTDDKCPQKQSTSTRVPQVGFYGCGNNFYLIPAKSLSFCPSYRNLAKISFLSMDKKLIFIQIIQGDCLACTNAVFGGGT